jgi:FlaG/FlaF family flagellin (archaellin)
MMKNKKGVSTVIIMVIMIALVLVAIGIVWVVVSGILTDSAGSAERQAKCLSTSFNVESVEAVNIGVDDNDLFTYEMNIKRQGTNEDEVEKIVVLLYNVGGVSSNPIEIDATDFGYLATKKYTDTNTENQLRTPDWIYPAVEVSVTPYIDGQICPQEGLRFDIN